MIHFNQENMCEHTQKAKVLRFFENAAYKSSDPAAPKWKFHVEEVCSGCGKHLQFMPQTPELIQELNGRLLITNFLKKGESINENKRVVNLPRSPGLGLYPKGGCRLESTGGDVRAG
jgi:hypothetical protein